MRFVARWPMRVAGKLRRVSVFQKTELLIESLHPPAGVGSSAQTTVAGHARLRISSGYVRCLLPPVSIKPSFLDVTV